jgi:hypothetical protein
MKKTIIIVVLIVCVVALAALIAWHLSATPGGSSVSTSGNNGTLPNVTPSPNAATSPSAATSGPQGTSFTIGTPSGSVQVNNFYAANPPFDGDGNLIIVSAADYYIDYTPSNSSFWLAVSGGSFNTVRPEVEAAFLNVLGINQTDACKLNVSEGVTYSSGDPLDGQSFPLSFCIQ